MKQYSFHVPPRVAGLIYVATCAVTIIYSQFIEKDITATIMFLLGVVIGGSFIVWKRNTHFK